MGGATAKAVLGVLLLWGPGEGVTSFIGVVRLVSLGPVFSKTV